MALRELGQHILLSAGHSSGCIVGIDSSSSVEFSSHVGVSKSKLAKALETVCSGVGKCQIFNKKTDRRIIAKIQEKSS